MRVAAVEVSCEIVAAGKTNRGDHNIARQNLLALHANDAVLICIPILQFSGEGSMGGTATSSSVPSDLDALIETDSKILDQVQKDLSQAYILFMSRVMKERLGAQAGESTSVFDHPRKSVPASPEPTTSS